MKRYLAMAFLCTMGTGAFAAPPDALFESGQDAFMLRQDFADAVRKFQGALDAGLQGASRESCLNWLAEAYWANNDIDRAIWTFHSEILNGKSAEHRGNALYRKAMAHMARKESALGIATYAQFAREYPLNPKAAAALMFQANYELLERADLRKAIAFYEQIALRYPGTTEAKTALGWLPGLRKMTPQSLKQEVAALAKEKAEEAKQNKK